MHNYGEALQYQREISGLTLTELAKKIGTSQQNLGRWERGEVLPNVDFCVRLAEFYGISVNELLGLEDDYGTKVAAPRSDTYTAEERQLIDDFRKLNPACKKLVKQTISTLRTSSNNGGQRKEDIS